MSILDQEIHEQPAVIRRLLEAESDNVNKLAGEIAPFNYVIIAARGTSDNAARYAQYLFGMHNRLPVALATPSLFTFYRQPPVLKGALVIGISQSGQSPDIVEVVAEASRQHQPTLAITNDPSSPLALAAQHVIPLHAGPERAVAATKTYTSSLAALALFSAALAKDRAAQAELARLPEYMEQALAGIQPVMKRVERYRYMERCVVIGRGYNYATAFEVALKIKELTRIITEQYSSADFRHGPIAIVRDGFPVIVISPKGAVSGDVSDLAAELLRRGGELLMVSDDSDLLSQAHLALPIPGGLPERLTPLVTVLPGQVFAMRLAEARGLNVDQPIGLTKVTETR